MKYHGIIFFSVALLSLACLDSGYPFDLAEGPVEISYTLQSGGTVDAVVTDSYMGLVRTLVESQEQESGEHSVTWDLRDDAGQYPENGLYNVEIYLNGDRISVQVLEVSRK